jgi:hypothetical protein
MKGIGIVLLSLLLITSLFSTVYFGLQFFNQIHTIDLAYNMCLLANDIKEFNYKWQKDDCHYYQSDYRTWQDRLTSFEEVKYEDGYIIATDFMITNFIRFGLSCFGCGLFSTIIVFMVLDNQAKIDLLENQNNTNGKKKKNVDL